MDYFIIQQDRRINDCPNLINWYDKLNPKLICPEKAINIPKRLVIEVASAKHILFLDVLSMPFFLVSEPLQQLIAKYEPYLIFKEIILLEGKNHLSQTYFMPILESISCLTTESEFNLDHSILKKGIIDPGKINDQSLFQLADVNSRYVVVRLDLAESIYRRDFYGFTLSKLTNCPTR